MTLLPFSRFPEGTLPSDQYRSSLSSPLASSPVLFPPSTLSFSIFYPLLSRFQYLSKFSEPAMNKLFPDFEYLNVFRGNGTAIEGPQKRRERMISIDRRVTWKGLTAVPIILPFFNFWETL